MDTKPTQKDFVNKYGLTFLSIGILVVFLILVGGVYWWVSKKSKGQVIFPSGINYTGNESGSGAQSQRPNYNYDELASASNWVDFTSPQGQYTFQYAPGMIPLIFPGDANDTVTFDVSNVPAQFNLMVLVEKISNYDSSLRGKPEQFVRNYWTYFGGLKGAQNVTAFQNEKGLRGWKVNYVNKDNAVGTDNYFFVIPNDPDKIIHVNNIFPKEGTTVFNRILNSLDYKR